MTAARSTARPDAQDQIERALRVLDYMKFVTVIGRGAVAVPKPDYSGFNRVIEPLIPDKQPLGKLLMENGGVRSAINMIAVNPSGVESSDCGALRNVAASYQRPASPESGLRRA
jgi:hypothetical protein